MTRRDYRLADFLGYLAESACHAETGHPALAETAWLEAQVYVSDLYETGTEASIAAGLLITAVRASGTGDPVDDTARREALDAAATAAAAIVANLPAALQPALRDAYTAVTELPADWRDAICTLLAPAVFASVRVTS